MLNRKPAGHVQVTSVVRNNKLLYLITAPYPEEKITLKCPHKFCSSEFYKKNNVVTHLRTVHNIDTEFEIEQQFYCSEQNCVYNLSSNPTKFFTGRKFLNQHYNKMHKDRKYSCVSCYKKFPQITDYTRHLKSCNVMYLCSLCKTNFSSNETYLVHLLRRHPDLHAKYKEEKKAIKRQSEKREETNVVDIQLPTKMRKDNPIEVTEQKYYEAEKTDKQLEPHQLEGSNNLQSTEPNITRLQPLKLNIDAFESSIPPINYVEIQNTVANKRQVGNNEEKTYIVHIQIPANMGKDNLADETKKKKKYDKEVKPNQSEESNVMQVTEFCTNITELTPMGFNIDSSVIPSQYAEIHYEETNNVAEENIIQESTEGPFIENLTVGAANTINEETHNEETTPGNENRSDDKCAGNEADSKKQSDNQISKNVANTVPSSSWSNKNDLDKLFNQSMRSQNSEEEIYFSESVCLFDIHTQTTPFDYNLFRSDKETQSSQSQTQSPDLSIKETQTCFCLFDAPKFNFGQFVDNLPSNSASNNVTSIETQTSEFGIRLRSDVLLSFSSAGTQTYFGETSDASM